MKEQLGCQTAAAAAAARPGCNSGAGNDSRGCAHLAEHPELLRVSSSSRDGGSELGLPERAPRAGTAGEPGRG